MLDNQEKIIKLINKIDELFDYYDIDDVIMSDNYDQKLIIFSNYLNELFKDGLNKELLDMISKIDKKELFYITKVDEFKNNLVRKEIVEYLDNIPLYMDYNLIKKYIKDNYKLAKYIKNKDLLLELVDINELVILLLDSKYLTKDFIIKYMKKSNFITEIFLGIHGVDNNIYKYSMYYKDNKEINNLLYEQVKEYLNEDIYQYLKASELVKTNQKINKLVITINPKFKVYTDNLEYLDCVLPVICEDKIIKEKLYHGINHNLYFMMSPYENLYDSFIDIIYYNFYYSYDINCKHTHSHSFEEVIKDLYYYPETFYIHKDEEDYFSKQELKYINRLKKILNIIDLKDIKSFDKESLIKRARNKKLKKILEYDMLKLEFSNLIKDKKIDTFILKYYDWDFEINKYLLIDADDNYLCLIKVNKDKIKLKDLNESIIDYKLLGYNDFIEYKNELNKKYEIKEEDYVEIVKIINIEDL